MTACLTLKQTVLISGSNVWKLCTWIRANTLSWTIVGGLFLGEMIFTRTPSMKSRFATKTWKRWPQFFTQVSNTYTHRGERSLLVQSLITHTATTCLVSDFGAFLLFLKLLKGAKEDRGEIILIGFILLPFYQKASSLHTHLDVLHSPLPHWPLLWSTFFSR